MKGAHSCIPEIFHIFWFGRYKYVPSPLRNRARQGMKYNQAKNEMGNKYLVQ
jgi:hypothetical protein